MRINRFRSLDLDVVVPSEPANHRALATVVGVVLTGVGSVYLVKDASEPVIFSLGFLTYPGGSLALSGVINLVSRGLRRHAG